MEQHVSGKTPSISKKEPIIAPVPVIGFLPYFSLYFLHKWVVTHQQSNPIAGATAGEILKGDEWEEAGVYCRSS